MMPPWWARVLLGLLSLIPTSLSGRFHDDNEENAIDYTALQGDLIFPVSRHIHAVQIVDPIKNRTVAEWFRRSERHVATAGTNATFPCGAIHLAGRYVVLLTGDDEWIDQRVLRVHWPPVSVQVPSELMAYRSPLQVKVHWVHLKCYPPLNVNLTARLVHCGRNRDANCAVPFLRASQPVRDIWQVAGLVTDVLFECQALDHPGYYRVLITPENDMSDVIGSSDPMLIRQNDDFQLQVRPKFARPCRRELPVFYRRPQCLVLSESPPDRIRLYGKSYAINMSFTYDYIGEKLLEANRSATSLPCRMLEGRMFDWLCFRYVHTATDGALVEITQNCIPGYNSTSMFQEPEWGPWSEFSTCTSQCGEGVRYRYRYCDRPPPQHSGAFCMGSPVEAERCRLDPCPTSPKPTSVSRIDSTIEKNMTECQCGCVKELDEGTFFSLVVSSALCSSLHITWIFKVPKTSRIRAEFDYLRLDCHDDDILTVRDGGYHQSPLIAQFQENDLSSSNVLETRSSSVLLDLKLTQTRCVAGFVATISYVYTSTVERRVMPSNNRIFQFLSMIPPPVMAISSLLLLILCVVFVLSLWYTQCRISRLFKPNVHVSLHPEESDYQMVSMATSVTSLVLDEDQISAVIALHQPETTCSNKLNYKKVQQQQSLPNTPHLHRAGHLKQMLSRSSTMSPRGFRLRAGRKTPVEIELCPLNTRKSLYSSEGTLKEVKVLNTTQSTNRSCSTVFDQSVDLELDYYDLDVRNAGCDAPDSFLRCLADDSTYWNVETVSIDDDDPSTATPETPFVDDEQP